MSGSFCQERKAAVRNGEGAEACKTRQELYQGTEMTAGKGEQTLEHVWKNQFCLWVGDGLRHSEMLSVTEACFCLR